MDSNLNPSSRPVLLRSAARLQETLTNLQRVCQSNERTRAIHHGLSASQSHALLALNGAGPLTVTALGERLGLEKSTASRLAKSLLTMGLVRKRSPSSDERRVILQVTEQGMRLSRKVLNDIMEPYVEALEAMEPEEREALPVLLDSLIRKLATVNLPLGTPEASGDSSQNRFR